MKKSESYILAKNSIAWPSGFVVALLHKYPLAVLVGGIALMLSYQLLIVSKRYEMQENDILENEAQVVLRKLTVRIRIIQVCILITVILIIGERYFRNLRQL
jgi:hypothetical protein